jgi:hypothetical protein
LRKRNASCANIQSYWRLLESSIERGQGVFDFGRTTPESNICRFKKQWGASPSPAEWQHYVRRGGAADVRPDNPLYERLIRTWRRLPIGLTHLLGSMIIRGIP